MARLTAAGRPAPARGAALLVVLAAVTLLSLATLVPLRNEQQAMQRERERELLFIGAQFRQALASYAAATPAGTSASPRQWADLLEDKRFPNVRRHLRRVYPDPMTGRADWTLLKRQGVIVGVASSSTREPLKRSGFALAEQAFAEAGSYADWKFMPQPSALSTLKTPAPAELPPAVEPDREPLTPQPPEEPAAPPANPALDKRRECARNYAAANEACALDQPTAVPCRNRAREDYLACLGGPD